MGGREWSERGGDPGGNRVLIVGDETSVVEAWCRSLGCAGFEAVALASESLDDVALVVLDADAGAARDERLAARLGARSGRPKVLLVTADLSAANMLRLAARGDLVLPKPLDGTTLVSATEWLLARGDPVADFARNYRLSPRETALLRSALAGRNNDEAADELGCTRATVSTYWNRIFRKTGVSGQRDLMILLLRSRDGSGRFPRLSASLVAGVTASERPRAGDVRASARPDRRGRNQQ